MSVLVLNQSVVHYESIGRGRPVLFLHTWVGSWRYWVPSLQAAAVSHSAYALDLYGFGDTAKLSSNYSLTVQAGLVGSFLEEMGIHRIALVGHGLGALVSLQFARMHPDRVARMVAVGVPLDAGSAHKVLLTHSPEQLLAFLDARGSHAGALLPDTNAIQPAALASGLDVEEIQRSMSALQSAGIPTLIIRGANDSLQLAAPSTPAQDLGPRFHEIVFPESGHFPMLDAADSFHRLIIDFLALDTGTSPRELRLKEEWRRRVR